jgi:fructosamine-3-kinase
VNLGFLFALKRCTANHHFAYDQQIINSHLESSAQVRGSVTVAILAQGTQPKPIASSWRNFFAKIRILQNSQILTP